MTIRNQMFATALAAGAVLATAGGASATTDANDLSPANRALFTTDHMASINQPTALIYDFEKKGTLEPGFTDTVEIDITKVSAHGRKDLAFHFLSGPNHIEFPDREDFVGNPIFMFFLERDVRELQRLTRGNALYYRFLIRDALVKGATMTPTTFTSGGQTHKGTEIRIKPFAEDPGNERYPRFAKKEYLFILSDEIPGGFYKVGAVTPDPSKDEPVTDDSVTFHEMRSPAAKRAQTEGAGQAN